MTRLMLLKSGSSSGNVRPQVSAIHAPQDLSLEELVMLSLDAESYQNDALREILVRRAVEGAIPLDSVFVRLSPHEIRCAMQKIFARSEDLRAEALGWCFERQRVSWTEQELSECLFRPVSKRLELLTLRAAMRRPGAVEELARERSLMCQLLDGVSRREDLWLSDGLARSMVAHRDPVVRGCARECWDRRSLALAQLSQKSVRGETVAMLVAA